MIRAFAIFFLGLVAVLVFWPDTARVQNRDSQQVYPIDLKVETVILPCVCRGEKLSDPSRWNGRTSVIASVNNPDDNPLNYKYLVTGGRLLGHGPNVIWDFNGYAPGEYSITLEVDDGLGNAGKSSTKNVVVAEPSCECPCECPSIEVRSHNLEVRRGGKLDFEAFVSGVDVKVLTYSWAVENGEIIAGQGTDSIIVRASSKKNAAAVTAELNIDIGPDCGCPTTVQESVLLGRNTKLKAFPLGIRWFALDEKTLTHACPWGRSIRSPSKDMIIAVNVLAAGNSKSESLDFEYSVSGGRITGSGHAVQWDLNSIDPGTYVITATVKDSKGTSDRREETITVAEAGCRDLVECPDVSLLNAVRVGNTDDYIVRANVRYRPNDLTLAWKITNGTILAGQGTTSIRVRSKWEVADPTPEVDLSWLSGPESGGCQSKASVFLAYPTPR